MWVTVLLRDKRKLIETHETLRLNVLETTLASQLHELVLLQLASRTAFNPPPRPGTAPARTAGGVAASLVAAAAEDDGSRTPAARRAHNLTEQQPLRWQIIFEGRLWSDAEAERPLGELGVSEGAVLHCLLHKVIQAQEQRLSCFPHSCNTDGGRVVHVLGEQFPDSQRSGCRFGTLVVDAKVEDDGSASGIAKLSCSAPPHPAGPVTLSVTFDGGVTWLEGPTFWYIDPSLANCLSAIAVPSSCRTGTVRLDAAFGQQITRRDHDDHDHGPGAGCV